MDIAAVVLRRAVTAARYSSISGGMASAQLYLDTAIVLTQVDAWPEAGLLLREALQAHRREKSLLSEAQLAQVQRLISMSKQ